MPLIAPAESLQGDAAARKDFARAIGLSTPSSTRSPGRELSAAGIDVGTGTLASDCAGARDDGNSLIDHGAEQRTGLKDPVMALTQPSARHRAAQEASPLGRAAIGSHLGMEVGPWRAGDGMPPVPFSGPDIHATEPASELIVRTGNSLVAQPNPVSLSVVVQVANRVAEVIEIPWGLTASGYLSYRSQASDTNSAAVRSSEMMQPAVRVTLKGVRPVSLADPGAAPRIASPIHTQAAIAASAAGLDDASRKAESTWRVTGANVRGQSTEWVQRLVRWIESAGETVLYVRDYRLGENEAAQLADRLAVEIGADSSSAVRVVINGRTYSNGTSDHAR